MNISVTNIVKRYGEKTVLNNVSIFFNSSLIHALVGQNGAGKSTLAGIISGNVEMDSGSIIIDDKECHIKNTKQAIEKGIILVHQTPLLADELTVKENLLLLQKGFILKELPDAFYELKKIWCPTLDINAKIKNLGGNHRFFVSLLQALMQKPKCLILDEPGALLTEAERAMLYVNLKQKAIDGINIIVITHNFTESSTYADTITVLNKGIVEQHFNTACEYRNSQYAIKPQINHGNMTNRDFNDELCFEIDNVSAAILNKPALLNASIKCTFGQITAVKGLQEAALGTLEDILTGQCRQKIKGTAVINTSILPVKLDLSHKTLTAAFLRKHKTAIVPSDRKYKASNPLLTVEQLVSVYCKKNTDINAEKIIDKAQIEAKRTQLVKELSGGMLQRLILERELSTNPRFLILCNPMQALDIQTQNKLSHRLIELKNKGIAILIIGTSDLDESICDRLYKIEGGVVKGVKL